ncbi:hypothetical protein ACFCZT_07910 [Streptomyces sp. NPDC056230]|uniref:hypothetical protein n=1 Tax=Streptomyces sp. NPDC056230 TaxID=3345754 RepID=UPI0035E15F63
MTSPAEPLEAGYDPNTVGHDIVDADDVDVLVDVPGLMSLARLRQKNGTLYEVTTCATNVDAEDLDALLALVPQRALRLGSSETETLGCECGDETTYRLWLFE